MCTKVTADYVAPGWGCCKCHTYNRAHRALCKDCGEHTCLSVEDLKELAALNDRLLGPVWRERVTIEWENAEGPDDPELEPGRKD